MTKYVLGVDYGTDSCRAVLVNTDDGREHDSEVYYYPRWEKGLYCDPKSSQYRQHPLCYLEGLKTTVKAVTKRANADVLNNIAAVSIDTTGSTPCAVDKEGTPLALLPEFSENPNAMFLLWKDHTSVKEAAEINEAAKSGKWIDYTKYIGGVYSTEWFFAKILHVLRTDEKVANAAYSWIEHCDWIPALLTGVSRAEDIMRSRCAAGHKAMWNKEFGGLPPNDFFKAIDPRLDGLVDRLYKDTYTSDICAGEMTEEWAKELGIPNKIKVGIGAIDCHMGAVGGNVSENTIVKVMGTSTCDVMAVSYETMGDTLVEGICGQVDGSVVPGMIGLEAGQSAFGDVYAWFRKLVSWPLALLGDKMSAEEIKAVEKRILPALESECEKTDAADSGLIALDWLNGRRTPYANQELKGAISGLTLATDAPQFYRAFVEATAFGSRAIVERMRECGVKIDNAIAIGGVAKKSSFAMKVCASVMNMPIRVCESEQSVALGASIFAAVVGGVYPNVKSAQEKMASPSEKEYLPDPKLVAVYDEIYKKYIKLGEFVEGKTDKADGKQK